MVAAAFIATAVALSFDGLRPMGLRAGNFLRSLWVVVASLILAAASVLVAAGLHTLHLPGGIVPFVHTYAGYALWAFAQQFLLQAFFLSRLTQIVPNKKYAIVTAGLLFAVAHLPSPILTTVTLLWGIAACLLFLHYRNLYPLAVAHAILGITLAVTVPGEIDHNMRVGLGYLAYGHANQAKIPAKAK